MESGSWKCQSKQRPTTNEAVKQLQTMTKKNTEVMVCDEARMRL